MRIPLPPVPATYLGMVLGVGGLANGWRTASRIWGAPAVIGEGLALIAFAIWALWLGLYGLRWLNPASRRTVSAELLHPALGFFFALVPVATLIASLAIQPHLPALGYAMFLAGILGQIAFSAWGVGGLWQGGREAEATTPVLYMPTVGGGFVAAIGCGAFGEPEAGLLFLGVGLFSLVVMESIVVHRLMTHTLPVALRATLGIHLAPAAVGCVAMLAVTEGPPDRLAQMLFGYALLQGLVMLRLVPWLREQTFSPAAWAYTFGVSALPLAALRFVERGQTGPIAALAAPLFVAANLIIGWIALRTLRLALRGELLPRALPPA